MDNIERIKTLSGIAPKEDLQEAYANTPADTSHPDPSEHGDIRDWGENVDTSLRRYLDKTLASPELPQPMTEDQMKSAYDQFLAEKEKVMEKPMPPIMAPKVAKVKKEPVGMPDESDPTLDAGGNQTQEPTPRPAISPKMPPTPAEPPMPAMPDMAPNQIDPQIMPRPEITAPSMPVTPALDADFDDVMKSRNEIKINKWLAKNDPTGAYGKKYYGQDYDPKSNPMSRMESEEVEEGKVGTPGSLDKVEAQIKKLEDMAKKAKDDGDPQKANQIQSSDEMTELLRKKNKLKKNESVEEVNETESNMFTRIMQLAGVHKVTEDDINQPEEAVEESEVSENEETVDEATEDRVEEATADEQEAVEETKEEVAEDETVEQDVVDEETVAETEQTVEDSDKADLDWLKKVIKY